MTSPDLIQIDAPRFWNTVMRSGEIGPGKAGGLRRLALTDADKGYEGVIRLGVRTDTLDRTGEVLEERPGSELVGWRYAGPYDDLPAVRDAFARGTSADGSAPYEHRVVAWDEVGAGLELVRAGQEVNYEGISGPVDLNPYGDVIAPAVELWTIRDDHIVVED